MTEDFTAQTTGPPEQAAGAAEGESASLWADAWRELRRSPFFVVPALLILVLTVMAIWPQLFTNADPRDCDLARSVLRPSREHWFGFDLQGCDYYARVIYGARTSITVGLLVTTGTVIIAVTFGSIAGYYGGVIDTILARITDIVFGIPLILGAIVMLTVLPRRGVGELALVLMVFSWPPMLRIMRSQVLSVRSADYVQAARALGAGDLRILRRHILPNAIAPVITYATVFFGVIIVTEAALSFLGVGLQLPAISWGLMISVAQVRILRVPHLLAFPGLFLSVTVFAFMMLGDALRDALDPRLR
ncbi:MAG TPA: ABC transporter permease [Egibacteraceae bacterium]|nr:ABC transporter permease [Egibacteraceae bacterium]